MFLEGRLGEEQLDGFRREADGHGMPSYPHPRRLPWLWEFPTVSMSLGSLAANETFRMWPISSTKMIAELAEYGFAALPEQAGGAHRCGSL